MNPVLYRIIDLSSEISPAVILTADPEYDIDDCLPLYAVMFITNASTDLTDDGQKETRL